MIENTKRPRAAACRVTKRDSKGHHGVHRCRDDVAWDLPPAARKATRDFIDRYREALRKLEKY